MPLTLGLIGGGVGLLNYGNQQNDYNRNMTLAAATAKNSPWTGLKPNVPQSAPSAVGDVGQGALSGAGMGMAIGQNKALISALQGVGNAQNAEAGVPPTMPSQGSPSLGVNTNMGPAPQMSDYMSGGGTSSSSSPWSLGPSQKMPATGGAMDPMAMLALQRAMNGGQIDGGGYYGMSPAQINSWQGV